MNANLNVTTHHLRALLPVALALCLTSAPPPSRAATAKTTKPPAAKPARKAGFPHDPYLGAIVVDAGMGHVLFEDHADARGIPASLVKLMDMLLVMEKIEHGELSLNERVRVSAKAASMPESNVGLMQKETFPVEELLYALAVRSANDAAVALAEKVAGSTDAFIELMNARARELGLTNTVFHSVNGLPPAGGEHHSFTTARELAVLCRELLKHPDVLRYTSTRERVFRPNAGKKTVKMVTHNHLVGRVKGCDGLKTGYISASGFSIVVTAAREGRRLLVVVLDSQDMKTRDAKAAELLEKGFAELLGTETTPPPKPHAKPGARLPKDHKVVSVAFRDDPLDHKAEEAIDQIEIVAPSAAVHRVRKMPPDWTAGLSGQNGDPGRCVLGCAHQHFAVSDIHTFDGLVSLSVPAELQPEIKVRIGVTRGPLGPGREVTLDEKDLVLK